MLGARTVSAAAGLDYGLRPPAHAYAQVSQKRLVVESPWPRFISACQWCWHPLRLIKAGPASARSCLRADAQTSSAPYMH
jgi:hypothetical protein